MSKKIIIGLAVLIIAGYSAFWFIQAGDVKSEVEDVFQTYQSPTSNQRIELVHQGINVTGFPLAMNVVITNPGFNSTEAKAYHRLALDGDLTINTSVFTPGFHEIMTDKNWQWEQRNAAGNVVRYQLQYNEPPLLEIEEMDEGIGAIYYEDEGVKLLHEDGTVLSEWETSLEFEINEISSTEHEASVSLSSAGVYHPVPVDQATLEGRMMAFYQQLGQMELSVEAAARAPEMEEEAESEVAMPPSVQLVIDELALATSRFNLSLNGEVVQGGDPNAYLPQAKLVLDINQFTAFMDAMANYGNLLSEWAETHADDPMLAPGPVPEWVGPEQLKQTFAFDDYKKQRLAWFLRNLSDNGYEDGEELTITIRSDGSGEYMIGQQRSQQVATLYQQAFEPQNTAAQPQAAGGDAQSPAAQQP